ncbi:MAG TPA: class I SAM-dependent methyltransferase [Ktedonobacteraceae bacterium]|nr:class I SAM-dependent methyltransferase [Ktedonobacteraceae bacterium]
MSQDPESDPEKQEVLYQTQIQKAETQMNGLLHQIFLQAQGGQMYPAKIPVNRMQRVIDLGCGDGEWVLELSRRFPQVQIFGVDYDDDALYRANVRRNAGNFRMAGFRKLDLSEELQVLDGYLDFVHLRRCGRFMLPERLPAFLQECVRILRPGGWLVTSEVEICEVSSPAFTRIYAALLKARVALKMSLDQSGVTVGIAAQLYPLLIQAHLENVTYELHTIDLGYMWGNYAQSFLLEIISLAALLKPLLVELGLFDAEGFDELHSQAEKEVQADDRCGWGLVVTAYGQKGGK